VLLATFASLRWSEAIALRRCHVDLRACTVRVRASFVERSNGQLLLGPPKSKAGMRVVGFPKVIKPLLQEHLSRFAGPAPGALVFSGAKGGPLRRRNFNKFSGWPHAVQAIGAGGLHFHDVRHTGNAFAAASGAGLQDLMTRMGHDSERAAIIYQHAARGADQAIAEAMEAHVEAQQADDDDRSYGAIGMPAPTDKLHVNCTCGAVGGCPAERPNEAQRRELGLHHGAGDGNRTRTISLGIRPIGVSDLPDLGIRCTASDRHEPCDTRVMARQWPVA
jgi:hypothetical protein